MLPSFTDCLNDSIDINLIVLAILFFPQLTENGDEIKKTLKMDSSKSLRHQCALSMTESHLWPMPLTLVQARSLQLSLGFRRRSKVEMTSAIMSYHEAVKRRFWRLESRPDFASLVCPYDGCGFGLDFGFCSKEDYISFIFFFAQSDIQF